MAVRLTFRCTANEKAEFFEPVPGSVPVRFQSVMRHDVRFLPASAEAKVGDACHRVSGWILFEGLPAEAGEQFVVGQAYTFDAAPVAG